MDDLKRLMVGIAARDATAFRHFRRATLDKVIATAFSILRDRDGAEEVAQETYLIVWTRAENYDQRRASPIAWISAISRNHAIDQLRGPRARASHVSLEVVLALPDHSRTPYEQTETRQALRKALQRLDELPADDKALLNAALLEQTPYAVLAAERNMPLPTLKSRVRRALIKLASTTA